VVAEEVIQGVPQACWGRLGSPAPPVDGIGQGIDPSSVLRKARGRVPRDLRVRCFLATGAVNAPAAVVNLINAGSACRPPPVADDFPAPVGVGCPEKRLSDWSLRARLRENANQSIQQGEPEAASGVEFGRGGRFLPAGADHLQAAFDGALG